MPASAVLAAAHASQSGVHAAEAARHLRQHVLPPGALPMPAIMLTQGGGQGQGSQVAPQAGQVLLLVQRANVLQQLYLGRFREDMEGVHG